ncbi:MAG TPA: hypothetical protein VGB73_15660 [Pyrinomonadaceae bacterium]|jgi:tryptophan-rich sensory protein
MGDLLLLLLYVTILAIPFQLMGVVAYLLIRKRNLKRARLAGIVIPPAVFFVVFLAIFLHQQSKPPSGLIPMLDGFMLLILLVVMIGGTILNLVFGLAGYLLIPYFINRRRARSGEQRLTQ